MHTLLALIKGHVEAARNVLASEDVNILVQNI